MQAGHGRPVDRSIAFGMFAVAVGVFAAALALTGTKYEAPPARPKPADTTEFIRLLRVSEHTDAVVDEATTRIRPDGQRQSGAAASARYGATVIARAGDTLDIVTPNATYSCQAGIDQPTCFRKVTKAPLPFSEVVAVAVRTGAFDVARVADATVGGSRARCYRLRGRVPGIELPGIGHQRVDCFRADGIDVRSTVTSAAGTDERAATRVQLDVTPETLAPLLAGFDQVAPKVSR